MKIYIIEPSALDVYCEKHIAFFNKLRAKKYIEYHNKNLHSSSYDYDTNMDLSITEYEIIDNPMNPL